MVRSSINTGGALRQDSILDASKESARSQFKFMIIIHPQGIPWVRTFETNLLLNSYLVSMTKHHQTTITNEVTRIGIEISS